MAKTRSMTRKQNHDDTSSSSRKKRFKTYDHGGVAPWLELNHDLLFLVMMQLGVIDFVAFSGVCKSWRSLALNNKKIFMASKPPMLMSISDPSYKKKECYCFLEDFEGRKFKTMIPNSSGRTCIGLTCGYLILLGEETKDLWLVNPITRHQLHFPCVPFNAPLFPNGVKAILVFSRTINGWVFVVLNQSQREICFSISGKAAWNHVSTSYILDLHAFKGKIYTIDVYGVVCEMVLTPNPKLTLLKIKDMLKPQFLYPGFVSWDEKLYVMDIFLEYSNMVQLLDLDEMKWVTQKERAIGELAFFLSVWRYDAAIKPESWVDSVDPLLKYERYERFIDTSDKSQKHRFFAVDKWYFPDRCLNVDHINE
ncbi:uncharacterized protein LOC111906995 isoform X1 [Lactuca sativa]|uniref:uncharacterized protein LOC111906995 isoform X1 n=1 Tax=Lactuca sativa TaxID=4236 RepID=UPI000CD95F17|nr:uncharacterized protein LOC111906995 isoform X1 [Lactuca sativa]XP_023758546.1 uncharacterized protein LOC111906995 isoform X1 [Lactuca sativa]